MEIKYSIEDGLIYKETIFDSGSVSKNLIGGVNRLETDKESYEINTSDNLNINITYKTWNTATNSYELDNTKNTSIDIHFQSNSGSINVINGEGVLNFSSGEPGSYYILMQNSSEGVHTMVGVKVNG